ncbi:TetR/AcrR family transcriptional regulator [Amycolatopsis rubida]|uniref:TetR/AcrR family transcriptional regulator n=1 Tax=Amycolatopsis rubida TaxID=112413 RepID=A0A1I5W2B9_9PSEU|nr:MULTISPECIES: TetR/AcrR family transcriptional regulator [Amycolatopsis]MYW95365.1 TetR family transcriptional regulator [Amycolatopsis rubida]NEC60354.1 TetR/AcrR family transcriptional regulator [Amycolatopsis rubida]OAP28230.1 HTH-type transcriptional regulator BetI [Amycolatopsis sp. M39]SFQ13396.1 transcriptional regulator, TetR family [Amycolatopsis rubida]
MTAQARRDDLIAAALDLFGTRAPELVTVDDIVARAEVSRPLFYRYFPSLRELQMQALRTVTDGLVDRLATLEEGPPEERLRAAVRGLVDVAAHYREGYVALLRSGSVIATSETDAAIDEVRNRAVELILEALAIPEPAPLVLLTLRCWTAVVEGTLLSWLQEGTVPRETLDGWLVDQLTAMLAATDAHLATTP